MQRAFQDPGRDLASRIVLFFCHTKTFARLIQRNFHGNQGFPVKAFCDHHGPLLELIRFAHRANRTHVFRGRPR